MIRIFTGPNNGVSYASKGAQDSRYPQTVSLAEAANNRSWLCPSKYNVTIHTGDRFNPQFDFSYAGPENMEHRMVPSFAFYNWPLVGLQSYEDEIVATVCGSIAAPTINKLFWVGNLRMHGNRGEAWEWAKNQTDVIIKSVTWGQFKPVPMSTYTKYSGLVDLLAAGFSGRLHFLFATGRPTIVVNRLQEQCEAGIEVERVGWL